MGPYPAVLQQQFSRLPPLVQSLHAGAATRWQGELDVLWCGPAWARALLWLAGLPRRGCVLSCSVHISPTDGGERWWRRIGDSTLITRQHAVGGSIVERVRGLTVHFAVTVAGECLWLRSTAVRWLGLPLPAMLRPRVFGMECVRDDRLCLSVRLCLPGAGCVLAYHGRLSCLKEKQA